MIMKRSHIQIYLHIKTGMERRNLRKRRYFGGSKSHFSVAVIVCICLTNCHPLLPLVAAVENNNTPLNRYGHQMIYLEDQDEVFMWGGNVQYLSGHTLNQTWFYNPNTKEWREIETDIAPEARINPGMTYDAKLGVIWLFGGMSTQTYTVLGDTWLFNLSQGVWHQLSPLNSPINRSDACLFYDTLLEKPILFGGYTDLTMNSNDMWSFSYKNNTWETINLTTAPLPVYGHRMAYWEQTQEAILIGGRFSGSVHDQQWKYTSDNQSWQQISADLPLPDCYWTSFSMNSDNGDLFVFGGRNDVVSDGTLRDLWHFNNSEVEWNQYSPHAELSGRILGAMVYLPLKESLLLYGGLNTTNGIGIDGLWEFSLKTLTWEQVVPPYQPSNSSRISGFPFTFNFGIASIVLMMVFMRRKNEISLRVR